MTNKQVPDSQPSPFVPHEPSESAYEPEEEEMEEPPHGTPNLIIPEHLLQRIQPDPQKKE